MKPAALPAVVLSVTVTACATASSGTQGPRVVQPGAPGEASRTVSAAAPSPLPHTDADVAFMQGMIHHHAQALDMVALLETRTGREDMRLLARRIQISQADEIRMMESWLRARGEDVPDVGAHAGHGVTTSGPLMPGMLTPDEMAQLAAAQGAAFDRLFLEFMIKHHDGALVMVRELFSRAGAGQQGEIFAFASDVEADQTIEIRRMQAMLARGG